MDKNQNARHVKVTIFVAALTLYSVAVVLLFLFLPTPCGGSTNNETMRSYKLVDLTDAEKKTVYDGLGIDIEQLAKNGFPTYEEKFESPADWTKEVHIVGLAFENVYCSVKILCHADEIAWERADTRVAYESVKIVGKRFSLNGEILKFDDTAREAIYFFFCTESADSAVYREFLRLFFHAESGK